MAVKASATVTLSSVVDVKSVWRYYLLQASTLSKPSKPTTNPPSGWTTTEPSYTSGSTNSLYFCDLTVFCDNTFVYSDVSLSSSYEAAKAAYNKAVAAQNAANSAQNTANNKGIDYSQGKMLYTDPTFASGTNSTKVYNNSGNGNVTVTRTAKSSDNPFSSTSYELTITNIGTSNPGCGGFTFENTSRANAVFIYRIFAKIPTGRNIIWAANAFGDGSSVTWLTSQAGTGKFTEYVCKAVCGATGTFSTIGFFYINGSVGSSSSPVKWYVAYATCFDMTTTSDTLSITTRVTAAETSITNNKNAIELRATKTEVTEAKTAAANAQSTADTAKSTADTVKTNLANNYSTTTQMNSAIEQSANSITSTVSKTYATQTSLNTTNANVTTAQNTANAAKTAAATAQSTADTAKTNAATAQSTANTAKANAATAQSTADTVKNNLANNYSTTVQVQTQMSQTEEEIRMDFTKSIQTTSSELQSSIDSTNSSMNTQFSEINKYIRFVDGKIILGETGNELMLTIQNDRVSFTQSGVEVAYFSNNNLYVKRAEVLTTMKIGNYEFTPRNDGGLALRKRSE